MITKEEYERYRELALNLYAKAGIVLTEEEKNNIEVADFGLNQLDSIGLQILTYINTDRYCAKEIAVVPYQTCPQHIHCDGIENGIRYRGKEETFRCRYGECYLYVEGEGNIDTIQCDLPHTKLSVFHEIVLLPGQQYTLSPNTWHWFQAGENGAVISEFSTRSRDERDIFADARIKRIPIVESE